RRNPGTDGTVEAYRGAERIHIPARLAEAGGLPRPVMEKLHAWLRAQFAEKKVEPNSGLGSAITCCLKHWEWVTLVLLQAGAHLDNNIERALTKAVLHRKNSQYYHTENGAEERHAFISLVL